MRTASLIMLPGLFVKSPMPTKSVTLLFQKSCWALGPKQPNDAPPKTSDRARKISRRRRRLRGTLDR